jgi:hypothetical protein
MFNINSRSYIKTSVVYSGTGMNDDVFELKIVAPETEILNYSSRIQASTYTGVIKYNNKINAKNTIQIGAKYSFINESNRQSQLDNASATNRFMLVDYNGDVSTLQNYVTWKHYFSDRLTLIAGLHNMNVLLNKKSAVEPRVSMNWRINNSNAIDKCRIRQTQHNGKHPQLFYFGQVKRRLDSRTQQGA